VPSTSVVTLARAVRWLLWLAALAVVLVVAPGLAVVAIGVAVIFAVRRVRH